MIDFEVIIFMTLYGFSRIVLSDVRPLGSE